MIETWEQAAIRLEKEIAEQVVRAAYVIHFDSELTGDSFATVPAGEKSKAIKEYLNGAIEDAAFLIKCRSEATKERLNEPT